MAKKLLLIDTNIISHALIPNQTKAYAKLFKTLESDYKFVITGYTRYELMCSSDKNHRYKIDKYLDQEMATVVLSDGLMHFSARVFYLYSKHVSTKGVKIGTGDIINAALAIVKDCELLTIDNNDYPTPFFSETDRRRVTYNSKKNRETTDTVYILKPDLENVKQCFQAHDV